MHRALCLLLCLSSLGFAQALNHNYQTASAPSSVIEVFYVIDHSTMTTYNIDPQTFEPTAVGTTALPTSNSPTLVTSPNGQFLYDLANVSAKAKALYVFETDSMGVPAGTPVQTQDASQLSGLVVNPGGTFLYSVAIGPYQQQTQMTKFTIVRSVINPVNGQLSQPLSEATYELDTGTSSNDCYLSVIGFNPAGTILYDDISCSGPHGSGSETYNQRSVDLQTGALGPDQQVYYNSYYAGSSYANVQFRNDLMFGFVVYGNQGPNADLVDVFQFPNVTAPAVNCNASMWTVCGNFGNALAHPSGQYVFLEDSSGATDIGQVNLETQEIAQVNSLPYDVWMFSPDGKITYGLSSTESQRHVYIAGFDPANGEVKRGGTIDLTSALDFWFTAQRY